MADLERARKGWRVLVGYDIVRYRGFRAYLEGVESFGLLHSGEVVRLKPRVGAGLRAASREG